MLVVSGNIVLSIQTSTVETRYSHISLSFLQWCSIDASKDEQLFKERVGLSQVREDVPVNCTITLTIKKVSIWWLLELPQYFTAAVFPKFVDVSLGTGYSSLEFTALGLVMLIQEKYSLPSVPSA